MKCCCVTKVIFLYFYWRRCFSSVVSQFEPLNKTQSCWFENKVASKFDHELEKTTHFPDQVLSDAPDQDPASLFPADCRIFQSVMIGVVLVLIKPLKLLFSVLGSPGYRPTCTPIKTIIRDFSISVAFVLSQGLPVNLGQGWSLSSSPIDDGMGD